MEIKAQLSNARIVPRRVRLLRRVVVGLPVQEARAQLMFKANKAAGLIDKVLNSAVANAKENYDIEESNLMVANIDVGEGIKFKRSRPAAKGMAHRYTKRTSHIKVILKEIKESKEPKKRKKKMEVETLTTADLERISVKDSESEEKTDQSKKGKEIDGSKEEISNKRGKQPIGGKTKTYRRKAI